MFFALPIFEIIGKINLAHWFKLFFKYIFACVYRSVTTKFLLLLVCTGTRLNLIF